MLNRLPSSLKSWLILLAKVAFTAAVLFYFLRAIDGARLISLFSRAAPSLLALVAFLSLTRMLVAGWRFVLLLAPRSRQPFGRILRHCFIGMFFNQLLPTAIGGDAVRVLLLRREGAVSATDGTVFVLTERVLGFSALGLMALLAAPFAGLPAELLWLPVMVGAGSVGAAIVLGAIGRSPHLERLPAEILRRAAASVASLLDERRALLAATLLSLVFQAVAITETWLLAKSIGVPLTLPASFALVPLIYILTVLPVSFGGVGVRELAFIALLLPLGIAEEESLAVALLTFAALALPGVVGGLLWWSGPRGTLALNEEPRDQAPDMSSSSDARPVL